MRRFAHTTIGVLSWLALAGLWALLVASGDVSLAGVEQAALQLAALSAAMLAVTVWWVRHNVAIHRRKGPRAGRATDIPRSDADRLGHPLRWELAGGVHGARSEPYLVVELDGQTKTYRRGG